MLSPKLFHRNMDGAIIPHSVNPGPQLACPTCGCSRFGKDFTHEMYGGKVVELAECIYCASKNGFTLVVS